MPIRMKLKQFFCQYIMHIPSVYNIITVSDEEQSSLVEVITKLHVLSHSNRKTEDLS